MLAFCNKKKLGGDKRQQAIVCLANGIMFLLFFLFLKIWGGGQKSFRG